MGSIIDLSGQRFDKLLVVKFEGRVNKHSMFLCVCDCGTKTVVTSNNLRRKHTTSCGCQSSKKTIGQRTSTHGLRNHPLYESWLGMRNRCYWPKHNRYKHYGGKGITVCDEWKDSFASFYEWSISNGWKKGLQIDRKDNNKNYSPDNCTFSTIKQQSRNRTSNVKLTIDGITKIMIEWAEEYDVHPVTISRRLKKGFSHKEAVMGKSI